MKKFFSFISIKESILVFIIFIFSLLINQYYGNKGVFPIDSFGHFDSGFRILLGEYPFKDFWTISGPAIDYLQSLFFYFFGVNWQIYVLHASTINALVALATFLVLKNFKLNIYYCFFYSILFSILAYPVSGTPFVDHHSAFFSLLGVYSLILGIKNENKFYWIVLPFFLFIAFFSKQVPSAYVIIVILFTLTFYTLKNKKFYWIKYCALSTIFLIIFLITLFYFQGINFYSFLDQYILYPQTLGDERYANLNIDFKNIILDFKYIYISMAVLTYINIKNIFSIKNYLCEKNFYYFLIIFLLTLSMIFHQLLTRNQIFIFFLVPILFAFSHINLIQFQKKKNFLVILMILLCIFVTTKYHLRFNQERKFHELNNVNFELSLKGSLIDEKFKGLSWISPHYQNTQEEINTILDIKSHIESDNNSKMVLTNYSFFSLILNQKLHSPIRWFIENGVSHPLIENKYFSDFRGFFIKKIKDNKIKVIYTVKPVDTSFLKEILGEKCIKTLNVNNMLNIHSVLNCDKLK
jgi:hypothetical protein